MCTQAIPITACQEKKADTAEMRILRSMRGITKRVENETFGKGLGVEKGSKKMTEKRLGWFGEVRNRDCARE